MRLLSVWFGAPLEARDKGRRVPLHLAAVGGHLGTALVLLQAGCNVDARDKLDVRDTPQQHTVDDRPRLA